MNHNLICHFSVISCLKKKKETNLNDYDDGVGGEDYNY